jgi:hypothetical protein
MEKCIRRYALAARLGSQWYGWCATHFADRHRKSDNATVAT